METQTDQALSPAIASYTRRVSRPANIASRPPHLHSILRPARMPRVGRKRPAAADDSDEDAPPAAPQRRRQSSDDSDASDEPRSGADQMARSLVRYALACEYSRQPIRRDAIREKIFGKHKVQWKAVSNEAQSQLRRTFGMELVELPMKDRHTLRDRQAVKSSQVQSSGLYVLASVLPEAYRAPEILPPTAAPSAATEAAYVGLYTTIISLIYLNGGALADSKLDRYLRRMNADINMPMEKTDLVLQKLIKQGYILKVKERAGDEEIVEWIVGPRGKVEVGVAGVQGLVKTVYGENAPEDLTDRLNKSLGLGREQRPAENSEETEAA